MTNTAEVQMKPVSELIASMKTAAEKAGCEQWQVRKGFSGVEVIVKGSVAKGRGCVSFQPVATDLADDKTAKTVALFSPANVLALIAALEQAQEDSEELTRFKDVMTLASQAVKDGSPLDLESLFKGELASAMFATMFAGEFVRHGANNYLELLYAVPDFGDFTVTIQRKEGKTPCERIAELETSKLSVKLQPRKTAADYVDGEFTNEDLAMIYNSCRLECEVKIKNAGGTVEGSD